MPNLFFYSTLHKIWFALEVNLRDSNIKEELPVKQHNLKKRDHFKQFYEQRKFTCQNWYILIALKYSLKVQWVECLQIMQYEWNSKYWVVSLIYLICVIYILAASTETSIHSYNLILKSTVINGHSSDGKCTFYCFFI